MPDQDLIEKIELRTMQGFYSLVDDLVVRFQRFELLLQGDLANEESIGLKGRVRANEVTLKEFAKMKDDLAELAKHKDGLIRAGLFFSDNSDISCPASDVCNALIPHKENIVLAAGMAGTWKKVKWYLLISSIGLTFKLIHDLITIFLPLIEKAPIS